MRLDVARRVPPAAWRISRVLTIVRAKLQRNVRTSVVVVSTNESNFTGTASKVSSLLIED